MASVQTNPQPMQAPGNEACESRGVKPKADPNHPGEPGKGKIGRVNASKLLMRLRNFGSPVRWLARRLAGQKWTRPPKWFERGHHGPGVQATPTPIVSHWCGTRQSRCGPGSSSVSQAIFGSEAQFPSGDTKVQEANAASRKARGIHNAADRAEVAQAETPLT